MAWSPFTIPVVAAPIDMVTPPVLFLPQAEGEVGLPVRTLVTAPPGTDLRLAQCLVPVGPDAGSSRCSPAEPVALDARGFGDVEVTLVDSLPGPGGPELCRDRNCAVTPFDGDGVTLGAVPVSTHPTFPLEVDAPGADEAEVGGEVSVHVSGVPDDTVSVAQCAASVVGLGHLDQASAASRSRCRRCRPSRRSRPP